MKQFAAALSEPFQISDFLTLSLIFVGILVVSITLVWRHFKKQKKRTIQDLRKQIAQDLHDEMGSQLSVIGLYSELIRQQLKQPSPEVDQYLDKIIIGTTGLYQSMKDLVWALNPQEEELLSLLENIRQQGQLLFGQTEQSFRLIVDEQAIQHLKLTFLQKRHLLFFLQEGMNNAFKHAACLNFTIQLAVSNKQLLIELWDDGKGFDPETTSRGDGLKNLERRAKKLGGHLRLQSETGGGTLIRLSVPMHGGQLV